MAIMIPPDSKQKEIKLLYGFDITAIQVIKIHLYDNPVVHLVPQNFLLQPKGVFLSRLFIKMFSKPATCILLTTYNKKTVPQFHRVSCYRL